MLTLALNVCFVPKADVQSFEKMVTRITFQTATLLQNDLDSIYFQMIDKHTNQSTGVTLVCSGCMKRMFQEILLNKCQHYWITITSFYTTKINIKYN